MLNKQTIEKAVAVIRKGGTGYRYFFDNLKKPDWIKPLKEKGFFKSPPPSEENKKGKTVFFPPWPESQYLKRMASEAPETVLEVILDMKETDNVRVQEDLALGILEIPFGVIEKSGKVETLIHRLKKWSSTSFGIHTPKTIAHICYFLTDSGYVKETVEILKILLGIQLSQHEFPIIEPKISNWDFEEILQKDIIHISSLAPLQILQFLCGQLDTAIRLDRESKTKTQTDLMKLPVSGKESKKNSKPFDEQKINENTNTKYIEDFSYIWRGAIENHKQNISHDVKDLLISAIRDVSVSVCKKTPTITGEVLKILNSFKFSIFHRISFHLLAELNNPEKNFIVNYIIDRESFNSIYFVHEYSRLVERHFLTLPKDKKKQLLDWINQGPADHKETQHQKNLWIRDRLSWIEQHLTDQLKSEYESLVQQYGEPSNSSRFAVYSSGNLVGPNSPLSKDKLLQFSIEELTGYLKNWSPEEVFMGPSKMGLGREIQSIAEENPDYFISNIFYFKNVHPTYVRSIFQGLETAWKQKKHFSWEKILDFVIWVLDQEDELEEAGRSSFNDEDPNWSWTRKSIVNLLKTALQGEQNFDIKYRKKVWKVLERLSMDPDPTESDEEKLFSGDFDFFTIAINAIRSDAINAICLYGLWMYNHEKQKGCTRFSFQYIPEVQEVLEKHLDTNFEKSLAVHAVYGRWFPWLVLMDPSWSRSKTPKIFPEGKNNQPYFQSAWETYLCYSRAYDSVFPYLEKFYWEHATKKLTSKTLNEIGRHLIQHLMDYYARGVIHLENDFLMNFWDIASPQATGYAIKFLRHHLKNDKKLPSEIMIRLKNLWSFRLSKFEQKPDEQSVVNAEVEGFLWWFNSGAFEKEWLIDNLEKGLNLCSKIGSNYLIEDKLVEYVKDFPQKTLSVLETMVRKSDHREVSSIRKTIYKLLHTLIDKGYSKDVKRISNHLIALGYNEFRNLSTSSHL